MENKYHPTEMLRNVWGKFFSETEQQNRTIYDYSIFIEVKNNDSLCYQVTAIENKPVGLYKGHLKSSSWREIKDHGMLFIDKKFLGRVHVRFKDRPIKIVGLSSKPSYIHLSYSSPTYNKKNTTDQERYANYHQRWLIMQYGHNGCHHSSYDE